MDAKGCWKLDLHYWVWQGPLREHDLSCIMDPLQKFMRAMNSLPRKDVCVHTISQLSWGWGGLQIQV